MAVNNLTDALPFLRKTVLLELRYQVDGEYFTRWSFVRIAGLMLDFQGFWHCPYFLGFEVGSTLKFPEEFFWDDIRSITVVSDRRYRIRSV